MKRLLSILILMLSVTASAFAEEVEIDGLWYEVVAKGKVAKVIQYKNNVEYYGDIVIPETVVYEDVTYSVTSIGDKAFSGCSGLTSVTIPNSVTSMGDYAFDDCSGLKKVIVKDIAAWCGISFSGFYSNPLNNAQHLYSDENTEITELIIPNSVTSIESWAFSGCSGLTSVTIPNSVTSIGNSTFCNCSGLTSLTIPNSVTSIGLYAFSDCSGLTSVTIPNSVTSIEDGTFSHCSGLTSVTIPNSVTSVGNWAFNGCSGLTSVVIGGGVETIGIQAFAYCPELTDVTCYAENVPRTESNAFEGSYIEYTTLHVPTASIDAYISTVPWSEFKEIVGLDGSMPETPKCATPTISYENGEIVFSCETEGVEYISEVTAPDAKKYNDSKISLTQIYKVSVYAVKNGYDNSDTVTAEIHISGGLTGDTNGDGVVNAADIVAIVNIIMKAE